MEKNSSSDDDLRPEYGEELFGAMKANRFAALDLKSRAGVRSTSTRTWPRCSTAPKR
jgi:hypothetical protein